MHITRCPWKCEAITQTGAHCGRSSESLISSRVVGVVQEGEANGRSSRDGQGGGSASRKVEEKVLERVSISDLPFQTILVDGAKRRGSSLQS